MRGGGGIRGGRGGMHGSRGTCMVTGGVWNMMRYGQ